MEKPKVKERMGLVRLGRAQVAMNLLFETDKKKVMEHFISEVFDEISDNLHEALQVTANAVGLNLVMEDSGSGWIRWKVEER